MMIQQGCQASQAEPTARPKWPLPTDTQYWISDKFTELPKAGQVRLEPFLAVNRSQRQSGNPGLAAPSVGFDKVSPDCSLTARAPTPSLPVPGIACTFGEWAEGQGDRTLIK